MVGVFETTKTGARSYICSKFNATSKRSENGNYTVCTTANVMHVHIVQYTRHERYRMIGIGFGVIHRPRGWGAAMRQQRWNSMISNAAVV